MNMAELNRAANKHRKIVLKRETQALSEDYRVIKVVNTLEAIPRRRLTTSEVQDFIKRGFTVEVRA